MQEFHIQIRPIDSWFFRESRPHNAGETANSNLQSIFPPAPWTIVGAFRATLAKQLGWDGRSDWSNDKTRNEKVMAVLGNGFEDFGTLSLEGPFLVQTFQQKERLLFPVPLDVMGYTVEDSHGKESQWKASNFVVPSLEEFSTSHGVVENSFRKVRLPRKQNENRTQKIEKTASKVWVTSSGLTSLLKGELPASTEFVLQKELWKTEPRIGIARDPKTHGVIKGRKTNEEDKDQKPNKEDKGQLYSTEHVRLGENVSLYEKISLESKDSLTLDSGLFPLGGESRLGQFSYLKDIHNTMPKLPEKKCFSSGKLKVVFLTPADLTAKQISGEESILPYTQTVCACIEKPVLIGGWDSLQQKSSLPLKAYVPAGSVFFLEIDASENNEKTWNEILSYHLGKIGCSEVSKKLGLGQIAIGTWNPQGENKK